MLDANDRSMCTKQTLRAIHTVLRLHVILYHQKKHAPGTAYRAYSVDKEWRPLTQTYCVSYARRVLTSLTQDKLSLKSCGTRTLNGKSEACGKGNVRHLVSGYFDQQRY